MKTKWFIVLGVLSALTVAFFTSCADTGTGGSATLALDTRAIAAKSLARGALSLADAAEDTTEADTSANKKGYTYTQRYKVVVPYTYDGNTYQATDFFDAEIYVSYATYEREVRNADAFSLTIDNLPLGKEVTFEMEVYEYHEHEKEAYQDVVEETPFLISAEPVTATITDDTSVVITLKEFYESPDPIEEEPAKEDPSTPAEEEPGDVAANTTFTLTATFPTDAEPVSNPIIVTLFRDANDVPLDTPQITPTTTVFSGNTGYGADIKTSAEASAIHTVEMYVFAQEAGAVIEQALRSGGDLANEETLEALFENLEAHLLYFGEEKPESVTNGVTILLEAVKEAEEEPSGTPTQDDTTTPEPESESDETDTTTPEDSDTTTPSTPDSTTDDTVTETTTSFITIPETTNIITVDDDNSFAGMLTKFESAAGVYYIRLNKDISYDGNFSYNTNDANSALVLDLGGNDLIITSESADSVFTVNSTMYVINGTIDDQRSAVATTRANLFYNKSTLYFKKVDFRNGKNQAIYQGKDNDQNIGGVTYVEDCTVMNYASTTPFYFDNGLAVISNTTFMANGSGVTQTVYNGGELIITGDTVINSSSVALANSGTTVLVGAAVNATIQNNGTLALLSAYTHGKTDFVATSGENTINATDYAIKNGSYATLILDETANISGTVYIDNSNNTIQAVQSKIFVANGTTSFKTNITIAPTDYTNYYAAATAGTAGSDYALVFGITEAYNTDRSALTEVQAVTEDLIRYFEIAEITGADGLTISGTWETVTYSDVSGAYNGYAIKKNN